MLLDKLNLLEGFTVVLASQSENRKKILAQSGIKSFEVSPSEFKEDLDKSSMTPKEYVMRTSEGKVKDKIAEVSKRHGKTLLITADSVITLEGQVFEKPESAEHAC